MSNVKASDLRQGNIINVLYSSLARPSMEPKIMQAIVRGTDDKTVITDCAGVPNEDKCSGIPLNKDWLKKLGFESGGYEFLDWIKGDLIFSGINWADAEYPEYQFLNFTYGTSKVLHIHFVHQLQNLYFALTGEELTLKD